MAFTWTKTIGVGNPNIADAINEIRTNTDTLNDTRSSYCATHYVTYDNAVQHANYATHNVTHLNNHNTSDRSTHDASYYNDYNASNLTNYNATYRTTHNYRG